MEKVEETWKTGYQSLTCTRRDVIPGFRDRGLCIY